MSDEYEYEEEIEESERDEEISPIIKEGKKGKTTTFEEEEAKKFEEAIKSFPEGKDLNSSLCEEFKYFT